MVLILMIRSARFFALIVLLSLSFTIVAQTVYVTKTGKKYHSENCRSLSHSKIEITLSKAQEYGYSACSVCKPPTESSSNISNQVTTIRKLSSSSQCVGLTKSGSRCKRMTTNSNGRCYQHQ